MSIRRDTVLRRLVAARDLLSDRNNFTKSTLARDDQGKAVKPESSDAVSFGAHGAVRCVTFSDFRRVGDQSHYNEAVRRLDIESKDSTGVSVMSLNDSPSPHARRRVVGVFNRAIRSLEAELAT